MRRIIARILRWWRAEILVEGTETVNVSVAAKGLYQVSVGGRVYAYRASARDSRRKIASELRRQIRRGRKR